MQDDDKAPQGNGPQRAACEPTGPITQEQLKRVAADQARMRDASRVASLARGRAVGGVPPGAEVR